MKLNEVLRFKKELFFEGAVQLDWFYDSLRRDKVAHSFVFHGPEYFGVSQEDVKAGPHQLVDTCSFVEMIAQRLYSDEEGNPLVMAIAGYGSGKSHLALTLASLFSSTSNSEGSKKIIRNLSDADRKIALTIAEMVDRPNLTIALNGMRDFNLTHEILSAARKALRMHNVDDGPLRDITRSYDVARIFLSRNFDVYEADFVLAASDSGIELMGGSLKDFLDQNLDSDATVFEVINTVYQVATGASIRWDDGISAGDILLKLQEAFCGDRGEFHKILIIFDEFGRFIEYASEFPSRAGQAALQQIFEAIQNSNKGIVFVGFIQSELKSYLARVEKSSNVVRYVGRYEASEKVYLSSNLETIFANLIERKDISLFNTHILDNSSRNMSDWAGLHADMLRWLPNATGRSLWSEYERFKKVVVEGTYPLHPVTTWMLANLATWLQQRSALSFVNSEFETLGKSELAEDGALPIIYPIRLIQGDFFKELLRAEEEGRQQSEYCILYSQVLRKHQDKCGEDILAVLAANLILRIGRFKTKTRQEALRALGYCLPMSQLKLEEAVRELESELGVLSFDEAAGCFDFIEDATGAGDFRRFIARQRGRTQLDLRIAFHSGEIKKLLGVDSPINTAFSNRKGIRTQEWQYSQDILTLPDITLAMLKSMKTEWLCSTAADKAKGRIVWVYMRSEDSNDELQTLQDNIRILQLDNSPVVFFILNDAEGSLLDAVRDLFLIRAIGPDDKGRFARYIPDFEMKTTRAIEDRLKEMAAKRALVTGQGLESVSLRLTEFCDRRFEQVYPRVVPFQFEGFHNRALTPAKKLLAQIAKNLLTGKMDYQSVQANSREFKNRIESVLVANRAMSWGVLTDSIQLIYPQHEKVSGIYQELDHSLEDDKQVDIKHIFVRYCAPPYGLNEFSLGLLIACYLAYKGPSVRIRLNNALIKTLDWADKTYLDKGIDFQTLEKSRLIIVDADQYAARYNKLCDMIERTADVAAAHSLGMELGALRREQEIPESLVQRLITCEIILEEANRLYNAVLRELEAQHEESQAALESLRGNDRQGAMRKLLYVILKCEGKFGTIAGSTRYQYSAQHTAEFKQLADQARKRVEQIFEEWMNGLRCENVAQVGGFQAFVKGIIKSFEELGYATFARKARSKLEAIVDDMKHIKMLQTIREQIETYLRECRPSNLATYDQLSEWQHKGQELELFITTHRSLSNIEISDYQAKIRNKLTLVEDGFAQLKAHITAAYDMAFDLSTLDSCHALLAEIKSVFSRNIKNQDRESLEGIAKETERFMAYMATINHRNFGRKEFSSAIHDLRIKLQEQEGEVDFNAVLDACWAEQEARFDEVDLQWAQQHLQYSASEISEWNVNRCVSWQKETELLPSALRDETIEVYRKMQREVTIRQGELRVEAIIALFRQLAAKEQKQCLDILLAEARAEVAVTKIN